MQLLLIGISGPVLIGTGISGTHVIGEKNDDVRRRGFRYS
jgi:hypothetical protein